MRILFFVSHPAQFHFFKHTITDLKKKDYEVFLLVKTKDILTNLLDELGWEYINILPEERKKSKISIVFSLLERIVKIYRFAKKNKIELFLGTDASIAQVAWLMNKTCITTLEDDYEIIKKLADLTFPFTTSIFTPEVCRVGKWGEKKIGYDGYMKMAYLHPNRFKPDISKIKLPSNNPYYIIRLSGLTAHHDGGIKGISVDLLNKIIQILEKKGKVLISSEKKLDSNFAKHQMHIPTNDMHHYLNYAELILCDSQSMAVEAAILGTPNIRISSFKGKISVLEELENVYGLTYGILPEHNEKILQKLSEIIENPNFKNEQKIRKEKLLADKIDVTAMLIWLIENHKQANQILKSNPAFHNNFKKIIY
jgi:predicted glycosyltransferase